MKKFDLRYSFKSSNRFLEWRAEKDYKNFKMARGGGKKFAKFLGRTKTPGEERMAKILETLGEDAKFEQVFTFLSYPRCRIVDFLIRADYIAIEVDGSIHQTERVRKSDARRAWQFSQDYPHVRFLRYTNQDVFEKGFIWRLKSDLAKLRAA